MRGPAIAASLICLLFYHSTVKILANSFSRNNSVSLHYMQQQNLYFLTLTQNPKSNSILCFSTTRIRI